MAFDGITVASIVQQLQHTIVGGRIYKIAQIENDALLFTIKTPEKETKQHRLLLSADASLPLVYLISENKPSPPTAPAFCMLLRKHLGNARILSITQPSLERVIRMETEHLDEMGDLRKKYLSIELMGKHSNIILLDEEDHIVDAIKRIPASVSSVREVLPGRAYFIPQTMDKQDPLQADAGSFYRQIRSDAKPLFKAIYTSYTGISPVIAKEICFRAKADPDTPAVSIPDEQMEAIRSAFFSIMQQVSAGDFAPEIILENAAPKEYAAIPLSLYHNEALFNVRPFSDISALILSFYQEKEAVTRIRQKSTDLRKIIQGAIERTAKKLDLQLAQLKDTEKKEQFRLYGELLTAYAYQIKQGDKKVTLEDYHTGDPVTITLDPAKTPSENAQRYYEKYNKLKRTAQNLQTLTEEVAASLAHLQSVAASLNIARNEAELAPIREELVATGYLKKKTAAKKGALTAKLSPLCFVSSDGFEIRVGRNNFQNDELTMKWAAGEDWWFHAKKIPGSHVILKTAGKEVPDRAFEEAAALAAYYSDARTLSKVEVDYVKRKEIKKPSGAKPGFVVYYTNYSLVIDPSLAQTMHPLNVT